MQLFLNNMYDEDGNNYLEQILESQTQTKKHSPEDLEDVLQGANLSVSGVLETNSINLNAFDEIRITTDIPIFSANTTNDRRDILCSVYPNCSYLGMVQYTNESFYKTKLNTTKIGTQMFSIRNEFDELIDLKNQEWSLTILLDTKEYNFLV